MSKDRNNPGQNVLVLTSLDHNALRLKCPKNEMSKSGKTFKLRLELYVREICKIDMSRNV